MSDREERRSIEEELAVDPIAYDFDQVDRDRPLELKAVPAGVYHCRVEEAKSRRTLAGDPLIALKFVVIDGPETGRLAAWDNVVFSTRAASRTRQVLAALGLPHQGRVSVDVTSLIGREAFVRVVLGSYRDRNTGLTVKRNEVPFDGIRPSDTGKASDTGVAPDTGKVQGDDPEAEGESEEDSPAVPF